MKNDEPAADRVSHPDLSRPVQSAPPPLAEPSTLDQIRAHTPARILVGRAGAAYRTATWLELRRDHAAARDAVCDELDLTRDLDAAFVAQWGLFEVTTQARTKDDFLMRPDSGRALSEPARAELIDRCPAGADFQIAIADGLSAAAVRVQVPVLLPLLAAEARSRGWSLGQPFFIRHGRVGTINDIGEILDPTVLVLLIGERPGLATSESLSAYMAYRPRPGHDDARRNLISNIHARGLAAGQAATRIAELASRIMHRQISGVAIKEEGDLTSPLPASPSPRHLDASS